jgi:SAM-dependent methyltransferase
MHPVANAKPLDLPAERLRFYAHVLRESIRDARSRILVVAAGPRDKDVFQELGFTNVVFSNLGETASFAPFEFMIQDAEKLSIEDGAFDFAVVHEALHHCHSPHRALLELYRVAKHGVLAVEARDSALMRLLGRLGLTELYERQGVYFADGANGLRGGPVPNFIYRWTEHEVEKTINTYAPHLRSGFRYFYGHDAPAALLYPGPVARKAALRVAYAFYRALARLFPRQQNLFAFFITKTEPPGGLQPWIELSEGKPRLDMRWARGKYGPR